jgi:8-oxo-dGTP pyrophosphatase MutT (NUDIX family)
MGSSSPPAATEPGEGEPPALPPGFEGLTERAIALARGEIEPVVPRDAATVVLLRDGERGVEVYLLRRVASMAFAAGMTVFPGGSVDPRDAHVPVAAWTGPPPQAWTGPLTADVDLARALVCAAVRETFEESGVLLAGTSPEDVVADTRGDDWEADRVALVDRTLSFAGLLERRRLVVRTDLLRVWGHWITPDVERRRFDTRFFVAALPAGQRTRDVGGEADRVHWLRPADAVEQAQRGEMILLPPTLATITELREYDTVADVLAARREIRRVAPKVVVDDIDNNPQMRFLLPWDEGYPA